MLDLQEHTKLKEAISEIGLGEEKDAPVTGSGIPVKLLYTPLDTLDLKVTWRTWDCPVPNPSHGGSTDACTVSSYGLNGRYVGMERLKKQTRDSGFSMRKAKPA